MRCLNCKTDNEFIAILLIIKVIFPQIIVSKSDYQEHIKDFNHKIQHGAPAKMESIIILLILTEPQNSKTLVYAILALKICF